MADSRTVAGIDPESQRTNRSSDQAERGTWQQSCLERENAERIAKGLGWFSIGLGLVEVVAPQSLAKLLGTKNQVVLLRSLGAREIATGIGILLQSRPTGWLWARVAGDALDLALLGASMLSPGAKGGVAVAAASVAGVTALDVFCAQRLSQSDGAATPADAVHVKKSISIGATPEELYGFWHDFQKLPQFMKHLESVQVIDQRRSHWVAKAPAGSTVQWDAEITDEEPNRRIAWRSLEGAAVDNRGSVQFEPAPGGRGTIVRVEIHYWPPAGKLGALVAKLFGEEPSQQVYDDLRRFKQLIETGEVITTEGQPAGRASSTSWKYDQTVRT